MMVLSLKIKKIQIDKYSHQQTIEMLDKNKEIRGANSGLNVTELMKLVEYYKSKRIELDNAVVLLAEKETKWNKTLTELNNKLEINTQKEEKISENTFIRTFYHNVDSGELTWHRDREDRIIESIGDTDWLIQIDNELPKQIRGEVFIPMGAYHRLIKGTEDLKIKLKKLY